MNTKGKVSPNVPQNKMMENSNHSGARYPGPITSVTTMNSENVCKANEVNITTNNRRKFGKRDEDIKNSKMLIYQLVAVSVSAILVMVVVVCFIALFVEVAKLKVESESQRTSPIMLQLQQVDGIILSMENGSDDQAGKVDRLNASILSIDESLHEATVSLQQLNTSELVLSNIEAIASLKNTSMSNSFLLSILNRLESTASLLNMNIQQLNTLANEIEQQLTSNFQLVNSFHPADSCVTLPPSSPSGYYRVRASNGSTVRVYCDIGMIGINSFHPADSCATLPPSSPSGYYWVRANSGPAVRVYCDMTRSCGGVTGGWTRMAYLDMTNSGHQCPSGFRQRTDSNKRTCVKAGTRTGCSFSSFGTLFGAVEYSKVCGKIIVYQIGETDAFSGNSILQVDGIVLTHGAVRRHIWSFVAARDEVSLSSICPCINTAANQTTQPPAVVGNNYFCDTGSSAIATADTFYGDDPLWDGAGCGPLNTCCSFNNPPWFYRQLPQPTTDNIDIFICRDDLDEDIAIETIEIYVQ